MDALLNAVQRKALIETIKAAVDRGMEGDKGDWGKFVCNNLRSRPRQVLICYLKTFDEEHFEFLANVLQSHSKVRMVKEFESSSDDGNLRQRPVCAISENLQHPIESFCPPSGQVPENEMSRLLIYKIPEAVRSEELSCVISGDFTIESKRHTDALVAEYYAWAIFKNAQEACQAFEDVEGDEKVDLNGWSEKHVELQRDSGKTCVRIRKMVHGGGSADAALSKKRAAEVEAVSVVSKKQKTEDTASVVSKKQKTASVLSKKQKTASVVSKKQKKEDTASVVSKKQKTASVVSKKQKTEGTQSVSEASRRAKEAKWREMKEKEPKLLSKFRSILLQHAVAYNAMLGSSISEGRK